MFKVGDEVIYQGNKKDWTLDKIVDYYGLENSGIVTAVDNKKCQITIDFPKLRFTCTYRFSYFRHMKPPEPDWVI